MSNRVMPADAGAASDEARTTFFTSANAAYLPKVAVLAQSVKAYMPRARFVLVLLERDHLDEIQRGMLSAVDDVVLATDLFDEPFDRWVFQFTVVEACTAVKPRAALWLLNDDTNAHVVYLDPDMEMHAPIDPVHAALHGNALVLTPHVVTQPEPGEAIPYAELDCFVYGTYNLGFFAVSKEGLDILRWWDARVRALCTRNGVGRPFTDQGWLDIAPGMFDGVHILRHPGVNVATWDGMNRIITEDRHGHRQVNGQPLILCHFSGWDSGAHRVARDLVAKRNPGFVRLSEDYGRRLVAREEEFGPPPPPWSYGTYDDGTPIPDEDRARFRMDATMREAVQSPFDVASWPGAAEHAGNAPLRSGRGRMRTPLARRLAQPAQPGRPREVDALRARIDRCRPTIAMLTLPGGGTAEATLDLARLLRAEANVLIVQMDGPRGGQRPGVSVRLHEGVSTPHITIPGDRVATLSRVLSALGVDFVHVHHRFGLEDALWGVMRDFDGRYGVTLHDYAFISPQPHLTGDRGLFVGTPTPQNWAERAFAPLHGGAAQLASAWSYRDFLAAARFVTAPSRFAADVHAEVLSGPSIDVLPNVDFIPVPSLRAGGPAIRVPSRVSAVPQVAFVGHFSPEKGCRQAEAVALMAEGEGVALDVHVIGGASDGRPSPITFHGTYRRDELGQRIAQAGATVAWIPSQIPETYSLVASEMMATGLPIVASDIGAVSERLADYPAAILLPHDARAEDWLGALFDAHHLESVAAWPTRVPAGAPRKYLDRYLHMVGVAGLPPEDSRARSASAVPA